jgi:CRISPR-associated protein Cas2
MADHGPVAWVVCYDIRDTARLRSVYKLMKGYGSRLQYSVYQCILTPKRYEELRAGLLGIVDTQVDSILFIPLGKADARKTWRIQHLGPPPEPYDDGPIVF